MPKANPPVRLERLRWKGKTSYRVLSYYFSVRWTWVEAGELAHRVLQEFAVPPDPEEERNPPTPGMPPCYSLVATGRGRDRRYELFYSDRMMFGGSEPSTILESFFWHVNAETIRRTGDFLLIHAGAVVTLTGEGVLIVGGSGSGKTTLTAALVRRGFGYLSDEAGAIDPVTRRLFPYPKALSVKVSKPDLFPERLDGDGTGMLRNMRYLLPDEIRPGCVSGPCDVRFVVAHRYDDGAPTSLTPITSAAGIVELGRNALNLSIYGSRGLTLLADVASGASHFTLVSRTLEEALQAVVGLTGVESPGLKAEAAQPTS
ncbi:MAG: hypothetical protein ACRDH7_04780 [Actinomycetota bacterium]